MREMWQVLGWIQDIGSNIKTIRWNSHGMGNRGTLKGIDFLKFSFVKSRKVS